MAHLVLFHHAQGRTPGVVAFADRLRSAGHEVDTPDLYDGATFASLDEGVGHAGQLGFDTLMDAGVAAAQQLPADVVYLGISLGVMPAQKLAQTRSGARAAVLMESCLPAAEFGDAWPGDVPVQIHGMDSDPFFAGEGDLEAARALVDSGAPAQLFLYPGDHHLFLDASLPGYDAAATDLVISRILDLLATL